MKKLLINFPILLLALIFWTEKTAGQSSTISVANPKITEETKRQQTIEETIKRLEETEDENSDQFYFLPELRLTKEQKLQTAVSKELLEKYADFLKLPKTGIFKISPNLCGDMRVVDVRNEKCLAKDVPSIAFYSFRRKLYDFQDWADLKYQDKEFTVGLKSLNVGLIAEVGDVSFESLDGESAEVKSLSELSMPKKSDEISAKKKEIEDGLNISGSKFFPKANVGLDKTYLLRSYAYRTREAAVNDRRIDIIVAFKVVEIDENESLTIIWKELHKGNSHLV